LKAFYRRNTFAPGWPLSGKSFWHYQNGLN
jgi:hypothetical protein